KTPPSRRQWCLKCTGNPEMRPALFTDLYELTMAQAYRAEGMDQTAVFELAYRRLPEHHNFILAGGLSDALVYLSQFQFTAEELNWLKGQREFSESFVASLENLRFTGDVLAMPEGTPVFPNEPLLQVVAPITEAQLVEVKAAQRGTAFRRCGRADLNWIFTVQTERVVGKDNTVARGRSGVFALATTGRFSFLNLISRSAIAAWIYHAGRHRPLIPVRW